jgi:hypothetical protein
MHRALTRRCFLQAAAIGGEACPGGAVDRAQRTVKELLGS